MVLDLLVTASSLGGAVVPASPLGGGVVITASPLRSAVIPASPLGGAAIPASPMGAAVIPAGPLGLFATILLSDFTWVIVTILLSNSACGGATWFATAGLSSSVTPPGPAQPWAPPELRLLGGRRRSPERLRWNHRRCPHERRILGRSCRLLKRHHLGHSCCPPEWRHPGRVCTVPREPLDPVSKLFASRFKMGTRKLIETALAN